MSLNMTAALRFRTAIVLLLAAGLAGTASVRAGDWPMWGRTPARNFYSPEKGAPAEFDPGRCRPDSEEVDPATTRNLRWVVRLGSQTYGNPTVAGGRVFVGTNNEAPRDPRVRGDRGIVLCLDAKTGALQWQLVVPKLAAGRALDWELLGICSSPTVDGDRVYLVTSRCEVMCLDVHGQADGNQGMRAEGRYFAGPGHPPLEVTARDADILWVFDMRKELGVQPHNMTSSSVLVLPDCVVATTSNGVDEQHEKIPAPDAPALILLDKETGRLRAREASGISRRTFHCNWSSPAFGVVAGRPTIIFGGGDGFCHGFDPVPARDARGRPVLRERWRYDCVPPQYKTRDGHPIEYPDAEGPSEIVATPVFYRDRVYVAIGQDPERGEGAGNLSCFDATGTGDLTGRGRVWNDPGLKRSLSTVAIDPATGLLFTADFSGYVYCFDAATGKRHWRYDMLAHVWGSPLVADGKVFLGDEDGDFVILPARKDFDPDRDPPLFETLFPEPIYSSAVLADGVLYVATHTHLYAIGPRRSEKNARRK
jgi:outer membrane protein assembly factor BamB